METYAVYLKPKSSSASPINSDTLFGAFCWALRALHGKVCLGDLLKNFNQSPVFILSAAFPYVRCGQNQPIRFYPKPLLMELTSKQVEKLARGREQPLKWSELAHNHAVVEVVEMAKYLKSADYLSELLFREFVNGQTDARAMFKRLKKRGTPDLDIEWEVSNVLITTGERKKIDPSAEYKDFWSSATVQHNQIDRVMGSTVEGRLFLSLKVLL